MRAADRGGFKSLGSAISIYKLGKGLPQDHKRAEQLLEVYFHKQEAFFEEHPEIYIEVLYDWADLGFSSTAYRLADIHAKGLLGVKADAAAAAAARWKKYAKEAQYVEKNGVPDPATRVKPKPDAADAQCESDAKALVEQKLPKTPAVTHLAHFNRVVGLCLVDVTVREELPALRMLDPWRVMVDVRGQREIGRYIPSSSKQMPLLDCRTQTMRLRASYEMQPSGCNSLAEYEAFVEKFMND